ncbi:MAG: hypothetical protein ACETWB_02350 [Anaerolineae bacterium]
MGLKVALIMGLTADGNGGIIPPNHRDRTPISKPAETMMLII